jgi:hypothetical protein
MIVGLLHYRWNFYTYTRTILHKVPGVEYQKVYDYYSLINRISQKLNRIAKSQVLSTFDLNNQFQDFRINKVDLLHLFNGISYGKTPWVSNFETFLPRLRGLLTKYNAHPEVINLNRKERYAFDALCGPACKQLIALSDCSRLIQLDLMRRVPVDVKRIEEKLTILHPPQEKMIDAYDEKELEVSGKIRFMLVGAGFFRKGGREILRVFERLVRKHQYPIELVIVSSLRMDKYAAHETESDVAWVKGKDCSKW